MPLNEEDDSASTSSRPHAASNGSDESNVASATGSSLLHVDVSNLPTLLSKSPPPFSELEQADEKLADGGLLDVDGSNLSFNSADSFSPPNPSPPDAAQQRQHSDSSLNQNSANGSESASQGTRSQEAALSDTTNDSSEPTSSFVTAPVCDPVQSAQYFAAETTFQNAFDAFQTDETGAGSADWANFDQTDNSGWAAPVDQAPSSFEAAPEPREEASAPVNESKASESLVPQSDSVKDDANDDDWSDFAEPKPLAAPLPKPHFQATAPVSAVQFSLPQTPKPRPLTGEVLIDTDLFLEQIFAKTPASIQSSSNESPGRVPTELPVLIDEDQVWQHIQRFTSETDASDSLQFKWKQSELENSFLSSLCVQRASSHAKKFKTKSIPSYIHNASGILQPTKADPTPSPGVDESASKAIQPDSASDTSSTKSMPPPQLNQAQEAPPAANSNQILDIDLSYFERSSSSSSVKSNSSKGKSESKPAVTGTKSGADSSNTVYLNKLLQDIFHNPQAGSTPAASGMKPAGPSQDLAATDKNLLTF